MTIAERFWGKVVRLRAEECWIWRGARNGGYGGGYGTFHVSKDRAIQKAHRVAWELTHGPIPDGLHVCHHCDNPPCVNPAHLFLGTHSDNLIDCGRKGRSGPQRHPELYSGERHWTKTHGTSACQRGEERPGAKLTEAQVSGLLASSDSSGAVAKRLGVSASLVRRIRRGERWGHVEAMRGWGP